VNCCPCCGSELIEPLTSTVSLTFAPRQQKVYDLIRRAGKTGLTPNQLVDRVYGNDPDGGPDDPYRCVMVAISQVNSKIRPLGMEIRRRGWGGPRVLVSL